MKSTDQLQEVRISVTADFSIFGVQCVRKKLQLLAWASPVELLQVHKYAIQPDLC